jgi:hypothetical protein
MGTAELQSDIKSILAKLKWSQKRLGREFYIAKHDFEDDVEIKRYEENVKKDLLRESISPELLLSYLDVISQHREFINLDVLIPQYLKSNVLSDTMEVGMNDISKLISKLACE